MYGPGHAVHAHSCFIISCRESEPQLSILLSRCSVSSFGARRRLRRTTSNLTTMSGSKLGPGTGLTGEWHISRRGTAPARLSRGSYVSLQAPPHTCLSCKCSPYRADADFQSFEAFAEPPYDRRQGGTSLFTEIDSMLFISNCSRSSEVNACHITCLMSQAAGQFTQSCPPNCTLSSEAVL